MDAWTSWRRAAQTVAARLGLLALAAFAAAAGSAARAEEGAPAETARFAEADRAAWLLSAMEGAQSELADALAERERRAASAPAPGWADRAVEAAAAAREVGAAALAAAGRLEVLLPSTFAALLACGALVALRLMRGRGAGKPARDHRRSAPAAPAPSPRAPAVGLAHAPAPPAARAFRAALEATRTTAEESVWGRILRLAAAGMTKEEIARTLGASPDDVDLVVGLERKRVELRAALAAGRGDD
jgi:hypothetical protein